MSALCLSASPRFGATSQLSGRRHGCGAVLALLWIILRRPGARRLAGCTHHHGEPLEVLNARQRLALRGSRRRGSEGRRHLGGCVYRRSNLLPSARRKKKGPLAPRAESRARPPACAHASPHRGEGGGIGSGTENIRTGARGPRGAHITLQSKSEIDLRQCSGRQRRHLQMNTVAWKHKRKSHVHTPGKMGRNGTGAGRQGAHTHTRSHKEKRGLEASRHEMMKTHVEGTRANAQEGDRAQHRNIQT